MTELRKKANSNFNEKLEAKKEYYEEMAEKKEKLSNQLFKEAKSMASVIPFGQPILVGHHSEKRDRNYRNKISNKFDKSFDESNKAEYYSEKAQSIGTGGIQSDDPEAIIKLKNKINKLKENVSYAKEINKELRKCKTLENAIEHFKNIEDKKKGLFVVKHLVQRESFYACPPQEISAYYFSTTSDTQEIRRLESRLNWMIKEEEREVINFEINNIEVKEEDGRINVYFPFKPDEDIRAKLKTYPLSMKWSRFNSCWTRKKTESVGRYFFENLKNLLNTLGEGE